MLLLWVYLNMGENSNELLNSDVILYASLFKILFF